MQQEPFFSIIIPCLNEEKSLPLLLKDLANQTLKDFEVIVVDGHSEDKTVAKAEAFKSKLPSLTVLTSKVRNVSVQRNLGGQKAHGHYLLFNDADNRLPYNFINKLKDQTLRHQPDIFTTFMEQKNLTLIPFFSIFIINTFTFLQKNTHSPYVVEALLGFKQSVFSTLKGFNTSLPVSEGTDILERAVQNGFIFTLFQKPRYCYSLRRLKKEGFIKITLSVLKIQISRLFGKHLTREQAQKVYPMNGGGYYQHQPK